MTEPGTPQEGTNPFAKDNTYPDDANPYHQPPAGYDPNNPYQRVNQPAPGAYPPAPPTARGTGYNQPQGYGQDHYQNSPYQSQPAYGYVPNVHPEAKSKADYAMIFGVIGIFFFSLVFGILALVYAKKAEEMGADAKIGKILGWVDIGISVLSFLWLLLFLPFMFAGASSGY